MDSQAENVLLRHGERLAAYQMILQVVLRHLAEKAPNLLAEVSQSVAERIANNDEGMPEEGRLQGAAVQRRVDDLLAAVRPRGRD